MKVKKLRNDVNFIHLFSDTEIVKNHAIVYKDDYAFEIACDCLRRHLNGDLDQNKYGMMEVLIEGCYRIVILYDIDTFESDKFLEEEA